MRPDHHPQCSRAGAGYAGCPVAYSDVVAFVVVEILESDEHGRCVADLLS